MYYFYKLLASNIFCFALVVLCNTCTILAQSMSRVDSLANLQLLFKRELAKASNFKALDVDTSPYKVEGDMKKSLELTLSVAKKLRVSNALLHDMTNEGIFPKIAKLFIDILPFFSAGYSAYALTEKTSNPSSNQTPKIVGATTVAVLGPVLNQLTGLESTVDELKFVNEAGEKFKLLSKDIEQFEKSIQTLLETTYPNYADFLTAFEEVCNMDKAITLSQAEILKTLPVNYILTKEALKGIYEDTKSLQLKLGI